MSTDRFVQRHRVAVLVAAALVPLLLCALLSIAPDLIEHTSAALLLVLIVVGAASTGLRAAGLLAAASSAVWFDFFLTAPYHTLRIIHRGDVEVALGLLLVGVAVTELALWGRRQQARASEQNGYLNGVLEAAQQIREGSASAAALVDHIERELVSILGLDSARYHRDLDRSLPRLEPDGTVLVGGHPYDVKRSGLPTDSELSLPVRAGSGLRGEFRLTAASHLARPTREQRRVAALLADQAALALDHQGR